MCCAISQAIAAYLAKGISLEEAVQRGRMYSFHRGRPWADLNVYGPVTYDRVPVPTQIVLFG